MTTIFEHFHGGMAMHFFYDTKRAATATSTITVERDHEEEQIIFDVELSILPAMRHLTIYILCTDDLAVHPLNLFP
jgi:hypothetical protein